jgi:hypothetical protein
MKKTIAGHFENGVWIEQIDVEMTFQEENGVNEMSRKISENINKYKTDRAVSYPSVGDQLDMIWHAMDSGDFPKIDSFYNEIKAVKDKYPKPKGV